MLVKEYLLSGLVLAASAGTAAAGGGFTMAADSLDKYCFYSIYTVLTGYTWYGPSAANTTSSSSSSSSSSSGHSSSGHSSSGHSGHGHRRSLLRRGHHGSTATTQCTVTSEVMSLYASAKKLCNKEQFAAVPAYWKSLCEASSLTLVDLTPFEANATDAYIASLPEIDPETNTTTAVGTLKSPVLLKKSYYERAYKSYVTHDYAYSKDENYGWGLMGYWGGILVLGMFFRLCEFISTFRASSRLSDPEGMGASRRTAGLGSVSSIAHWIRTYIVMPASFAPFSTLHQKTWYYHSIPKRLDLLIVFGFWALSIILACVNYQSFTGNIQTPSLHQQNWQYSSDRTGYLSYACLPFLWLFGGRNNIFSWVTGFSVQSFNMFHRHVAWVCTVLAVVHSINYTVVFVVYDGRYQSALLQNYFYVGVVATCAMCVMIALSHTWIRTKFYETFLIIHIVLGILTIYALFRHTSFAWPEYNFYLWPLVAIWGFDRFVRLLRIAYCNLNVRFGTNVKNTTATVVTYSKESDLVTIHLQPVASNLRPGPGQYYHLYQPFTLRGWENHPFTMGAYTLKGSSAPSTPTTETLPNEKSMIARASSSAAPSDTDGDILTFYIRPYNGWTKRLRTQCLKSPTLTIHPTILLEGPYGEAAPLHTYDHVLLIVGGTGIASAVPYILDHLARAARHATRTTALHLVWTVRQPAMVDEVLAGPLGAAANCDDIRFSFFCSASASAAAGTTKKATSSATTTSTSSSAEDITPATLTDIDAEAKNLAHAAVARRPSSPAEIRAGRPDIHGLVGEAVAQARASDARVAALTCGPAAMADECRDSVYQVMRAGWRGIGYFEEAFG